MQSENEWSKSRRCASCGASFSLETHGSPEARSAAEFLQQGILNAAELPPLISRCPKCLSTGKMSEREAVALVREMGLEMESGDSQRTHRYIRQGGMLGAILSAMGLLLAFAYARLRQGDYNPTFFYGLFTLMTLAGIGASVWAHTRLRQLDTDSKGTRK